jgi:hypothetical protein
MWRLQLAGALPHVRALAAAFGVFAFVCTGAPGFDLIENRTEPHPLTPPILRAPNQLAIEFERRVRDPIQELFIPIERFFRIAQSWHVYLDGPKHVARLEVWADGELLYRSLDEQHAWLEPILRNRRVRPMAKAVVTDEGGRNWREFSLFIVRRVRAEWPDTQKVVLDATWSPWPGDQPVVHHSYIVQAPDWAAVTRTP